MTANSIPIEDLVRPCPSCKARSRLLCIGDDGASMPHAIHAERLALVPVLDRNPDGTFTLSDRAEEA